MHLMKIMMLLVRMIIHHQATKIKNYESTKKHFTFAGEVLLICNLSANVLQFLCRMSKWLIAIFCNMDAVFNSDAGKTWDVDSWFN